MKRFETPEFVEIKMDAEVGSYQEENENERDPSYPPFASQDESARVSAAA